jgi:hypothetical protein
MRLLMHDAPSKRMRHQVVRSRRPFVYHFMVRTHVEGILLDVYAELITPQHAVALVKLATLHHQHALALNLQAHASQRRRATPRWTRVCVCLVWAAAQAKE